MRLLGSFLAFTLLAGLAHANPIWRAEGDKDIILFGTIHILKPEAYPLPEAFNEALGQCDRIWFELDPDSLTDPNLMAALLPKMQLPADQTLQTVLSPGAYQKIQSLAELTGVPIAMLERFKPWAALNQLTLIAFQQRGFTAEGLDQYLHQQTKARNLPQHSFETLFQQLAFFDAMNDADPNAFVDYSTEGLDQVDELIHSMYQQWQTGNYAQMFADAKLEQFPIFERILLAERNQAWLNTLQSSKLEGTHCVAVGMLHMAADHGLVNGLKQQGYQVTSWP